MDADSPAGARSDGFWDLYSRVYDGVYHLIPYRSLLWDAYDALDLKPGMRVLDAGCGTGNFEHFISSKGHPPITIDALDASPGMLDAAKRKCRDLDHVRFSLADLNGRLPFEDATFDRIVSINVFYALENHDQVMLELLRVLKPDGLLVLSSPLPTYSVSAMVADHFRRIRNILGTRRRLGRVAGSAWVLGTNGIAQWLLNNLVINSREAQGRYQSLDEPSMRALLQRRVSEGIKGFAITLASANQNLLATVERGVA